MNAEHHHYDNYVYRTAMVMERYKYSYGAWAVDDMTNSMLVMPLLSRYGEWLYTSGLARHVDLLVVFSYLITLLTGIFIIGRIFRSSVLRAVTCLILVGVVWYQTQQIPLLLLICGLTHALRMMLAHVSPEADRQVKRADITYGSLSMLGCDDGRFKYLLLLVVSMVMSNFAEQHSVLRLMPVVLVGVVVLMFAGAFGGNSNWTVILVVLFMLVTLMIFPETPVLIRNLMGSEATRITVAEVAETFGTASVRRSFAGIPQMNDGRWFMWLHSNTAVFLQLWGMTVLAYLAIDSVIGPNVARTTAVESAKEKTSKSSPTMAKGHAYNARTYWVCAVIGEILMALTLWGPVRLAFWVMTFVMARTLWQQWGRGYWQASGENVAIEWIMRGTAFITGANHEDHRHVMILFSHGVTGLIISPLVGIYGTIAYLFVIYMFKDRPRHLTGLLGVITMQVSLALLASSKAFEVNEKNRKIDGTDCKTRQDGEHLIEWDLDGNGGNSGSYWLFYDEETRQRGRMQTEENRARGRQNLYDMLDEHGVKGLDRLY